jgi:hypothetical protein
MSTKRQKEKPHGCLYDSESTAEDSIVAENVCHASRDLQYPNPVSASTDSTSVKLGEADSGVDSPVVEGVRLDPETSMLHYFWGSRVALQIYSVCLCAITLQEVRMLHGITLVFLVHMLERAIVWGKFFHRSQDYRDFKHHIYNLVKLVLSEADKTLEGDSFRQVLTGFSLQFWNSTMGRSFLMHLLRKECSDVNDVVRKQTEEMIERSKKMQHEMQKRTLRLSHEMQYRRTRDMFQSTPNS